MTTVTKNPKNNQNSFSPIPTRIRDVREAQIPPLVIQPLAEQNKAAVVQSLGELSSKLADVHRTAAEAYLSQAMYAQSLPHLEAAVTFGTDQEYRTQLGFVRYLAGDDIGAINAFNMALAVDNKNLDAWFNLGMVLFGQKQFAEAEDCFRRVLELSPNEAQTWNNRGVCLFQVGRSNDAKNCFEQALRIDPQDQDARFNLANLGTS